MNTGDESLYLDSEQPKRGRGRGKRGRGVTLLAAGQQSAQHCQTKGDQVTTRGRGRGKRGRVPEQDEQSSVTTKKTNVEASRESNKSSTMAEASLSPDTAIDDCPVCLDPPVHEIELECGHTYCFLCAKGLAESGNPTCSLCRRPIAVGYFSAPKLIKRRSILSNQTSRAMSSTSDNTPADITAWYYEGRNGWWRFEERHSADIELAFQEGKPHTELLICGQLYFINLQSMTQFRRDCPIRIRKIKRDLVSAQSIGVAGLLPSN